MKKRAPSLSCPILTSADNTHRLVAFKGHDTMPRKYN